MVNHTGAKSFVEVEADAIRIGGKPYILLCASLFYFRIPRAYWRERMEQLKACGYNSIDIYFPWNHHERSEGEWDFGGERDVDAFLGLAAEIGLWVVARPGPYICSEWDGGALPAYLLPQRMRLRDHNPQFESAVGRWFDQIMPILHRHQAGAGGTVIAVQLDNELDFYGCSDPHGYISALRDMALSHGITVPLIACAGQGGVREASGLAAGVLPTCNFYPDNRDAEFEDKVQHYQQLLNKQGYPLLVTETNRSHYLLRRLLSRGAKLLGPYLQVSGTDFGFTNAINNWGRPLAFMTSDYDFGGMISPEGQLRDEALEGRLLGRLIQAYGPALAEAIPNEGASDGITISASRTYAIAGPYSLALKGGGTLLFLTNLEDSSQRVTVEHEGILHGSQLILPGGTSLTLPFDVPLSAWGAEGTLKLATAELYDVSRHNNRTELLFHADGSGTIVLQLRGVLETSAVHGEVEQQGERLIFSFEGGQSAACGIALSDGSEWVLHVHDRQTALRSEGVNENGELNVLPAEEQQVEEQVEIGWSVAELEGFQSAAAAGRPDAGEATERASMLEEAGIYRGYAWYEAEYALPNGEELQGILLRQASDIISLYVDNAYQGTTVPGGGSAFIPLVTDSCSSIDFSNGKRRSSGRLTAKTEIWGHTNFADLRLPSLSLHAMKGLGGMSAISRVQDISSNWRVYRASDVTHRAEHIAVRNDRGMQPIVSFGNWLSEEHPAYEYYSRSIKLSAHATSWTLHFKGLQSLARLYINGIETAAINPFDPYVDISPYVVPGQQAELTVFMQKVLGLPSGRVMLYEGVEAEGWSVAGAEEPELLAQAETVREQALAATLPLELASGKTAWLSGLSANSSSGRGWRMYASGSGIKLTVFLERRLVGRLCLTGESSWPVMSGGSPDSIYLPGAWYGEKQGELLIMVEAIDVNDNGRLDAVSLQPVQA